MRAAAIAGDPSPPAGWKQEVRRHFERSTRRRYRTFGRFMLGLETQDAGSSRALTIVDPGASMEVVTPPRVIASVHRVGEIIPWPRFGRARFRDKELAGV
jgi:hypothetical protein